VADRRRKDRRACRIREGDPAALGAAALGPAAVGLAAVGLAAVGRRRAATGSGDPLAAVGGYCSGRHLL